MSSNPTYDQDRYDQFHGHPSIMLMIKAGLPGGCGRSENTSTFFGQPVKPELMSEQGLLYLGSVRQNDMWVKKTWPDTFHDTIPRDPITETENGNGI